MTEVKNSSLEQSEVEMEFEVRTEVEEMENRVNQNVDLDFDLYEFDEGFDLLEVEDFDENNEAEDTDENDDLGEAEFNLGEMVPSISKIVSRIPEAGVISVVNSGKNGNRVAIASDVISRLNKPQTLQVGFIEGNLVLCEYIGDEYTSYTLRKQAAKHIIYSKELVEQITKHCELDFSERTSITFPKATYLRMAGEVVAIICKD